MAQTQQGAFEIKYHHIEAPTKADDAWGREHKSRRLIVPFYEPSNPDSFDPNKYRDPLLYQLSRTGWQYKRKLDGENLRVCWDGEQALWNGKSDNFQCGAELTDFMNKTFLEEIFEEKFGREIEVVLFGEHMGPGVQGNELGLDKKCFVLYDVCINGFWQAPENIREIAQYFGIQTCYDFMSDDDTEFHQDTLLALIQRVARGDFKNWEGIVATPIIECRNQKGNRMIVKIKNRDYFVE